MLRLRHKKARGRGYSKVVVFDSGNSTKKLLVAALSIAFLLHICFYFMMKIEPYLDSSEEESGIEEMTVDLEPDAAAAISTQQEEAGGEAVLPAFVVEPLYNRGWQELLNPGSNS